MIGIYIHIPFCARKCPYCDFFSVPYQKNTVQAYVNAVIRNLKAYANQISDPVDTIYFGGGTPSLLSAEQIHAMLTTCREYFNLSHPEITLEINPARNQETYLHDLYLAGINRLSIGIQSFSDSQLQLLGRTHTVKENCKIIHAAVNAGFENISCDLILALPEQTEMLLSETLEILIHQPITHVSAYLLQIEEHTPFAENPAILEHLPDDDTVADRYLQTVQKLESAGIYQYEISSFAKPGYESRHNLKYWTCADYLGIGTGAHSCLQNRRFYIANHIDLFCQEAMQKEITISEQACDPSEKIMLALRTVKGIPPEMLSRKAQIKADLLTERQYMRLTAEGNLALTPKGFMISNAIIAMLID